MAIVAAIAGVAAFYVLVKQPTYIRVGGLISGLLIAVVLAWTSQAGRDFFAFSKESIREAKKVVWPTRKEAGQITAVVFAFVLVMAIFLWGADQLLGYLFYDLILGWRK